MICDEIDSSMTVVLSGRAGLCASCRFAEIIVSSRGSTFYLCKLSETDANFARYPVLPVRQCSGYQPEPDRP
jgi:hypothetical protein